MKKIIFQILTVLLITTGCGFKVYNQAELINFSIEEIRTTGNNRINYNLKNKIKSILNNNFEKWEKYFIKTNCYCILKTGKNSGKQCSRKKFGDTNYCKTHLKKFEPNKVENEETCLICPKVIN